MTQGEIHPGSTEPGPYPSGHSLLYCTLFPQYLGQVAWLCRFIRIRRPALRTTVGACPPAVPEKDAREPRQMPSTAFVSTEQRKTRLSLSSTSRGRPQPAVELDGSGKPPAGFQFAPPGTCQRHQHLLVFRLCCAEGAQTEEVVPVTGTAFLFFGEARIAKTR